MHAVRGFSAPVTAVIDSAGIRFLRIAGQGQAGFMVRDAPTSRPLAAAALSWSVRVESAPPEADLTHADTDDAPLRVFVVFESPRRLFARPRTLFYSLDRRASAPTPRPSHVARDLRVIGMPSADPDTGWQMAMVDPVADNHRLWGTGEVRVVAIGVMQDTDQTGGHAVTDLRHLTWSTTDAPHP